MRMRYGQFRCVDVEIIVEEDVNVDDAIVVLTIHRLLGATHIALNLLGGTQQDVGGQLRLHTHCCIEEGVLTLEPPWFSGKKSGLCPNRTNPPLYLFDGGQEVLLFVAKVGSK